MALLASIRGRDPVDEHKFERLGWAAGLLYLKRGDHEYALSSHPVTEDSYKLKPGEVFVRRRRDVILEDGERMPTTVLHLGLPVEAGTFAKLSASRSAAKDNRPRRWPRVTGLAIMERSEPTYWVTGPATSSLDVLPPLPMPPTREEERALSEVVDLGRRSSQRQLISTGGHEPPPESVAGTIAWLRSAYGVELEAVGTPPRLSYRPTAKPPPADVLKLLDLERDLFIGELTGKPLACCWCERDAVRIVGVDAPACLEDAGQ